tara:strand:- start:403 stop:1431 length:1029 start_codon:yes stop_codon:yes gene_type:complete
MALIDSGSKSSRLLASRRYTHDTLTTAQESFTNVLDLGSSEVYTQAAKIPSSNLPFSSSIHYGQSYSVLGEDITKYWFRQKLTKSNLNNETWFFLNPTGSDSGVGAQLIDSNQATNFLSPKYAVSSLATSTTEDITPGYLAVLYKSSAVTSSLGTGSLGSGDIVSTNDYIFDYKTGVIQFMNSGVDPTDSEYLYITAYQYVGTTLETGLELSGKISGSTTSHLTMGQISSSGDIVADGDIVAYNSSDRRLKNNVEVIKGALDKIDGISGYEFDWNDKSPGWAQERGHDVGVMAQEVQKIVPEIVIERKNGYLGVDYKRLVPLLIESIKELKKEVDDLKKKVN